MWSTEQYEWHELRFPARLEADAVAAFLRSLVVRPRHGLLLLSRPVVVEVTGQNHRLTWRIGFQRLEAQRLLGLLTGHLPDVSYQAGQREIHVDRALELRTSSHRRPLRSDVPTEVATAVLQALQATGRDQTLVLQWLIGPWLPRHPVQATRDLGRRGPLPAWNDWIVTAEQATALRHKQSEPLFGATLRIGITAPTAGARAGHAQAVLGALQLARHPGVGFERRPWIGLRQAARRLERLQHPLIAWPCTVSAAELAACLGFPIGNPTLPGVTYSGHRQLPAAVGSVVPASTDARDRYRVTGEATYPGTQGYLIQRSGDALRHTHLIGPTGSGKSVCAGGLALSDIAAGRGAAVIDMKGDLALAIADRIPDHRRDDVVLLEPGTTAPVGFNVLSGTQPDLIVDTVVHVMHDLYAAHWGPRTADVMVNGLQTLVRHGGMTLVELPVLLTNPQFRARILHQLGPDDLGVGPFWQQYEALSDADRAAVIGPTLNKLRAWTSREVTRRILGQIDGFDLRTIFTERKVLLVNLSQARLGSEGAQLIGSLLMGSLWSVIQQRGGISPERRHPVFIYLDEFQHLLRLPVDLTDALATARGLGVGLILAHQNLDQLTGPVKSAVLANARSRIAFATGNDDARVLARVLGGGLTPEDLQSLGAYETYQALCVGGVTVAPASARTLDLPVTTGSLEKVRRNSAKRFGMDGQLVDVAIRERRRIEPETRPVGSRKRGGTS